MSKKVSVLMPVHDAARSSRSRQYLHTAVESILTQDHPDLELIAINDGSTDDTLEALNAFAARDDRIRVINLEQNVGIAAALNAGAKEATGDLIARMDADDISVVYRLSAQVDFLERKPEVGIVGAGMLVINEDDHIIMEVFRPQQHADILRFAIEYGCPFVHGSVMIRRAVFERVGGYPEWKHCEDFELWFRLLGVTQGANIPEFLYLYRQHPANFSHTQREPLARVTARVIKQFQDAYPDLVKYPAAR